MKSVVLVVLAFASIPVALIGQAGDALLARVKQERVAYLKTLQELAGSRYATTASGFLHTLEPPDM